MTQINLKQPYLFEGFFDNFWEQTSCFYKSLMIDDLGCQGWYDNGPVSQVFFYYRWAPK